jgi:hypothetical protein
MDSIKNVIETNIILAPVTFYKPYLKELENNLKGIFSPMFEKSLSFQYENQLHLRNSQMVILIHLVLSRS